MNEGRNGKGGENEHAKKPRHAFAMSPLGLGRSPKMWGLELFGNRLRIDNKTFFFTIPCPQMAKKIRFPIPRIRN